MIRIVTGNGLQTSISLGICPSSASPSPKEARKLERIEVTALKRMGLESIDPASHGLTIHSLHSLLSKEDHPDLPIGEIFAKWLAGRGDVGGTFPPKSILLPDVDVTDRSVE